MSATDAVEKKARRYTGEWAGLPYALRALALLCAVGTAVALFVAFDDDANRVADLSLDWLVVACFAGAATVTYCAAAWTAALRGILNNTRR